MDDYRIRIAVEAEPHFLARWLGEAGELAGELERRRLAVSHDGNDVFVYAATYADAERAAEVVHAVLREQNARAEVSPVEHWLDAEDRWDSEPPGETWEEEEADEGYAPWEVRVDAGSRAAAGELVERLEREGYTPLRRLSYVIVGVATREEAEQLAARLHGEVEAGGELVWETLPGNPFAVFGGMGGAGTPAG